MYELGVSLLLLLLLVGCFWGGQTVQRVLREHHRSQESIDTLRVLITLLVTFAALVLSMLISNSQTRVASLEAGLRTLSIDVTEVDRQLREYGPEGDPMRGDLILYAKEMIADTWQNEAPPPGNYPRQLTHVATGSVESIQLSLLLNRIEMGVHRLTPQDDFHRSVATTLAADMVALSQQRWTLIENAQPSLSWPFLAILMFWLAVIFVIAGLSSPRNVVVVVITMLAAVSLASSIFLAMELDQPMAGLIKVSSTPMRDALRHLEEPTLPPAVP
jgi:hypothetical protein